MPVGPDAAPLWEQVLIVVLSPPLSAGAWWLLSRGWGQSVQGGSVSQRTRTRQTWGFWIVLALGYLVTISMAVYAYFF
jgi:hypothetical protein